MKKKISAVVWILFKDGRKKRLGRRVIYLLNENLGILKDGRPVERKGKYGTWFYIPY